MHVVDDSGRSCKDAQIDRSRGAKVASPLSARWRIDRYQSGSAGAGGTAEQRRLKMENDDFKLALAEATVQLRIWQRGTALIDQVPSKDSKP